MTLAEIIFLAVALGVDCLIVSFSQGLLIVREKTEISEKELNYANVKSQFIPNAVKCWSNNKQDGNDGELILNRLKKEQISNVLALIMGLFQGGMPLISYILTGFVYDYISPFAKSLVFGIFTFLGIKFIIEAFRPENNSEQSRLDFKMLILLGIATSIDALGAGISLNLTHTPLFVSCGIIALTSYLMSLVGFWGGCCFKAFDTKYLEISAGAILIFLAVKSLL